MPPNLTKKWKKCEMFLNTRFLIVYKKMIFEVFGLANFEEKNVPRIIYYIVSRLSGYGSKSNEKKENIIG